MHCNSTHPRPALCALQTNKPGMTWTPNPPPQDQCFQTLDKTVSLGGNFWNAGELYGTPEYNSLHLLNAYFTHNPHHADKVVLSIKGGLLPGQLVPDGSEANIRRSVDESLRVLDGKKRIDIFECARQDPNTSIEQTVTVLGELVKEGKIGGIGLSEVDAETVRRAYVTLFSRGLRLCTMLTRRQRQGPPHCCRRGRILPLGNLHPPQRHCPNLRRAQRPHCGLLPPRLGRAHGRLRHPRPHPRG